MLLFRPNVVFILADNVGYGDLGPYGGGELRGAPTPRIDELAREGLRLTQFLVELEEVEKYYATLKKYPNPRAPDITRFANPTG